MARASRQKGKGPSTGQRLRVNEVFRFNDITIDKIL